MNDEPFKRLRIMKYPTKENGSAEDTSPTESLSPLCSKHPCPTKFPQLRTCSLGACTQNPDGAGRDPRCKTKGHSEFPLCGKVRQKIKQRFDENPLRCIKYIVGLVGSSVTRVSGSSTQNVGLKRWQASGESIEPPMGRRY